ACSSCCVLSHFYLFFFQAEDGIRDFHVTGVQTCALPILVFLPNSPTIANAGSNTGCLSACFVISPQDTMENIFDTQKYWGLVERSEERRVGKEGRFRG